MILMIPISAHITLININASKSTFAKRETIPLVRNVGA